MAKERSLKSVYQSRYGGGYVSPAQYVTEFLCERVAAQKGNDLPQQFWQIDEWEDFFKTQIILFNKYLKKYTILAIVKALKDRRCKNVNSFAAFFKVPSWKNILLEYQREIDAKNSKLEKESETHKEETVSVNSKPKKPRRKENILNKLKDIENNGR